MCYYGLILFLRGPAPVSSKLVIDCTVLRRAGLLLQVEKLEGDCESFQRIRQKENRQRLLL